MNNKTLIILMVISFFATGIIPIFAYVFIGLLVYYFVKNKDKIKADSERKKRENKLYKEYLKDDVREELLKVTHYKHSDLDRYSFAKYYASEEGQQELKKDIKWDTWYEDQVEAMEEHKRQIGENEQ